MSKRITQAGLVFVAALAAAAVQAQDRGTYTLKHLLPETALKATRAALEDCRKRGYQVAVAVVDRSGVPQAMMRDRFAGPHTPGTAIGKGFTAVTFRTSTLEIAAVNAPAISVVSGAEEDVARFCAAMEREGAGTQRLETSHAFHSRMMGKGPATLSDMVLAQAGSMGIGMTFKADTSSTGLSDHEAYELAGIPATCVCWRTDPVYHTTEDVSPHVQTSKVATAGKLVLEFARGLDAAELSGLQAR